MLKKCKNKICGAVRINRLPATVLALLAFVIGGVSPSFAAGAARIKREDSTYKTNSVVEKTERLQESVKC